MIIDENLLSHLESFLSERRIARMKTVLAQRTRYIVCVIEDLYNPRNGSAIIRHCDALGIQEIHAIGNRNHFSTDHQVDLGTGQWLDLNIYNLKKGNSACDYTAEEKSGTPKILTALKQRGFRIVATCLQAGITMTPEAINLNQGPIALVFGTEKHGISDEVKSLSDEFLHIPMVGFVDSFNISAAAAIILHVLSRRIRQEHLPWQLEDEDARQVYSRWVESSVRHATPIMAHFRKNSSSR